MDSSNTDAEDLLAEDLPTAGTGGEIRRLTILFVDLVDSTVLSTRVEPETYRMLVGGYREHVRKIVDRYGGHLSSTKGDGLLAVFGYPTAHEDGARRAVAAGLDITRAVMRLSEQAMRRLNVGVNVRVGIHRGLVYLDVAQDDVYGFAANFAARISSLAEPDTVAVSDAVAALVGDAYELAACPAASVKGVEGLVNHHRVLGERPPGSPSQSPPLIGRHGERASLQQLWQQACDGTATRPFVAFRGEPGIGKTRLARAAAEIVEASGGAVVELRGSPLHTDTGLHPVRRLLERRCGITRLTTGAERLRLLEGELRARGLDPVAAVPLLAPVLGVGPEHGYAPAAVEGRALYELIGATVHRYVRACLENRAGLIIAEDVHWFDTSTIDLLDSILTGAGGRLLIVLTGRDSDWLRSSWPVTLFELPPLTEAESDALIDALHPGVTDEQRAGVRKRCDGVPFHIEHVVAGLGVAEQDWQVPEALYESLFARLHTRADVVPVVEAAAIIGRSGDVALLRTVVGGEADVDAVMADLMRARVFECSDTGGWRFRHELIREVAAELAPPTVHRKLHARTGRALTDTAPGVEPDWRVVAGHYAHAQRFDEAVKAFRKASVAARRRGALHEAQAVLTEALNQLTRCAAEPTRDRREIALRLERGFLAGATQGSMSGQGPADFERCLELASAGNYDDELFATLTALIGYYVPRAELRRAHELLESLSARVTKDRPWSEPVIASSLGSVAWLAGDFTAARTHLRRALVDQSAADPRVLDSAWWVAIDPISSAHTYLALTHVLAGNLDGADGELAASLSRCDELGFPQNAYNRAHTYFVDIWVRLETGQFAEAATRVAELRQLSEQSGLDLWQLVGATQHSTVKALNALAAGADTAALCAAAEKIAKRVDGSRLLHLNLYLTFHDAVIGRVLIAAGKPRQARERMDKALRHADETGMHFYDAELMRLRAHTFSDRPRRAAFAAALETARRQGATLFELRCQLDYFDLVGDDHLDELADVVGRFSGDPRWPECVRAQSLLT